MASIGSRLWTTLDHSGYEPHNSQSDQATPWGWRRAVSSDLRRTLSNPSLQRKGKGYEPQPKGYEQPADDSKPQPKGYEPQGGTSSSTTSASAAAVAAATAAAASPEINF